jgi:hypothetical protein
MTLGRQDVLMTPRQIVEISKEFDFDRHGRSSRPNVDRARFER